MARDVGFDRSKVRSAVSWSVGIVAALALVGIIAFWPSGEAPSLGLPQNDYFDATVTEVSTDACDSLEVVASVDCNIATFELTSGPDAGEPGEFVVAADELDLPTVSAGDAVVVLDVPTSPEPYRYVFVDLQRSTQLWAFVALFVVVVVAFGRWKGVRALIGLAAGGLILVAFVVPSLLRDNPAVLVALAGTVAIAVLALYMAHGFDFSTTVALAGTLAALLITALLALLAASAANLTGLGDEDAQVLRITADALDMRGLLVAGIVVGALGVIDDVTVTQVSTVAALRRADPSMGPTTLYREAVRVGRDHIASTVNTLVLAYAGAALPLVLLFAQGSAPISRILTGEVVAVEIIRMMVGSIGLVLSVPLTTALAAVTLEPSDVGHHDHGGHADAPAGPSDTGTEPAADIAMTGTAGSNAAPRRSEDDAWQRFSGDERDFWDDSDQ